MLLNFLIAGAVHKLTPPPSPAIQQLVEDIRVPKGSGPAHEIEA